MVGCRLWRSDAVATDLAVVAPLTDLCTSVASGCADCWLTALADDPTEHLALDLLDLVRLIFGLVDLGDSR